MIPILAIKFSSIILILFHTQININFAKDIRKNIITAKLKTVKRLGMKDLRSEGFEKLLFNCLFQGNQILAVAAEALQYWVRNS